MILSRCAGAHGRTYDQPVDGLLLRDGVVYVHLHRDVPEISPDAARSSRIEQHSLSAEALANITRAAHASLRGC